MNNLEEIARILREAREDFSSDLDEMDLRDKQIEIAERKLKHFTGKKATKIKHLHTQNNNVMYELGKLKAVIYEAEIDGEVNNYIHEFGKTDTPILAVSFDGKQLYILGGAYEVTNCGIENSRKRN